MSRRNPSVLWSVDQSLSAAEKLKARQNIGIKFASGDSATPSGNQYDETNNKIVTQKDLASTIEDLDKAEVGESGKYVEKIKEDDGIITATLATMNTSIMDVTDEDTLKKAPTTGAVKTAIENLDSAEVGESGKYVEKVKEADGIVTATLATMNTSIMDVTGEDTLKKAPTTGAVKTAIENLDVPASGAGAITGMGADKTIASISETDGIVAATFQDIALGNITHEGKLQASDVSVANDDKLVITDNSAGGAIVRSDLSFDGTTRKKVLSQKGKWCEIKGTGVISVSEGANNADELIISSSADANQNAFATIQANGINITATDPSDLVKIDPGTNITLSVDTTEKSITINCNGLYYAAYNLHNFSEAVAAYKSRKLVYTYIAGFMHAPNIMAYAYALSGNEQILYFRSATSLFNALARVYEARLTYNGENGEWSCEAYTTYGVPDPTLANDGDILAITQASTAQLDWKKPHDMIVLHDCTNTGGGTHYYGWHLGQTKIKRDNSYTQTGMFYAMIHLVPSTDVGSSGYNSTWDDTSSTGINPNESSLDRSNEFYGYLFLGNRLNQGQQYISCNGGLWSITNYRNTTNFSGWALYVHKTTDATYTYFDWYISRDSLCETMGSSASGQEDVYIQYDNISIIPMGTHANNTFKLDPKWFSNPEDTRVTSEELASINTQFRFPARHTPFLAYDQDSVGHESRPVYIDEHGHIKPCIPYTVNVGDADGAYNVYSTGRIPMWTTHSGNTHTLYPLGRISHTESTTSTRTSWENNAYFVGIESVTNNSITVGTLSQTCSGSCSTGGHCGEDCDENPINHYTIYNPTGSTFINVNNGTVSLNGAFYSKVEWCLSKSTFTRITYGTKKSLPLKSKTEGSSTIVTEGDGAILYLWDKYTGQLFQRTSGNQFVHVGLTGNILANGDSSQTVNIEFQVRGYSDPNHSESSDFYDLGHSRVSAYIPAKIYYNDNVRGGGMASFNISFDFSLANRSIKIIELWVLGNGSYYGVFPATQIQFDSEPGGFYLGGTT